MVQSGVGTCCPAHDRDSLERLCRYIARPAVSNERLSVNDRGQVVYRLKHAFRDGTTHVVLDPIEFMRHIRVPLDPIDFIARLAAPEVPLAARARSLIEKTLTHLAARETGGINPPAHHRSMRLSPNPGLPLSGPVLTAPAGAPIPAAPRLPCPAVSSAFPTCLPVCRREIAPSRPRFVGSHTDVEPHNDRPILPQPSQSTLYSSYPSDGTAGHVAIGRVACVPCYRGTMITSFRDRGTQDVFNGKRTRAARRVCPQSVWRIAARKLDQLDSATELRDLHAPPGNRLEALSGDRAGQHSIRINDQYRVCFLWTDAGAEQVEIVDYH